MTTASLPAWSQAQASQRTVIAAIASAAATDSNVIRAIGAIGAAAGAPPHPATNRHVAINASHE